MAACRLPEVCCVLLTSALHMLLFVLSFETVTESHTLFENRTPCSTSYTCLFYRRRFVASLWKMHYYIRIPCETYNNMVKKKAADFVFQCSNFLTHSLNQTTILWHFSFQARLTSFNLSSMFSRSCLAIYELQVSICML